MFGFNHDRYGPYKWYFDFDEFLLHIFYAVAAVFLITLIIFIVKI